MLQTATRTVLLIEDNPEDCATIRRYLSRDSRQTYTLVEKNRGTDGLRACQVMSPDVVLLDYHLPDMDGSVFLEHLRKHPTCALLPVIILTGRSSEDLALETLRGGAVEYITKDGLTPESLRLALHAAIEKGLLRRQVETHRLELEHTNLLLREQQAQLRLALDAARMHTWDINLQKVASRAGEDLDTLLNQTALDANSSIFEKPFQIHPDDRQVVADAFQAMITGNIPYDLTYRILLPNAMVRWVSTRGNSIRDEHGTPIRLMGISMDVTAQKQLEEVAHQQQQAFQMIAENSPDIIARFDRELRYLYINPAITQVTCLPDGDFLGRTNRELGIPGFQADSWDVALEAVFVTGKEGIISLSLQTPAGLRWYQSKLAPERDQTGEVVSVLSIVRDVTALQQAHEDLKRSEVRARRLLESNIIGVVVAQGTTIIEANEAFLDLIGAQRSDLEQGRIDWVAITPPEYAPQDERSMHELQTRGFFTPFEKEFISHDGRRVPILIGGASLQQEPPQSVCFILDLTPQKRVEQERIRALAAFQTLADHAPDVITRHDAATFRYLYANPAIEQATGIPVGAFVGHTYQELGMEEDLCILFDQTLNQVVRTGQPTRVTYPSRGRHYQALLVPEENAARQLSSILVISHDITTLKMAHQQTEDALSALIMLAQVLVIPNEYVGEQELNTGTTEWTARHLLDAICRTFGCAGAIMAVLNSGTEVIETLVTSGFDEGTEPGLLERLRGQQFSLHFADAAVPARLHAGEVVLLDVSASPYSEQCPQTDLSTTFLVPMLLNSTLLGVITLFYPLERLRRFSAEEDALVIAMGRLAALLIERTRLFAEREKAQTREMAAEQARNQMDVFLGVVSHELKTPLTSIKGNLQLAERQLGRLRTKATYEDGGAELVTTILTRLARAQQQLDVQNRLVNDLIDVSRIHSDRLELRLDKCDVALLVQEAVEDQRLLAPTRQIELHTSALELLVLADAERVGQVITNYLTNALKYSEASCIVEVNVDIQGPVARVVVRDSGPGLSLEQQQHVWEQFYRVPGIVVKSGTSVGLGLGLHICQELIERQGGQVGVESVLGHGSAFWFTLPLAQ